MSNEQMTEFDPEGSDYDYGTAKAAGMGPTGDGTEENAGHWGSVADAGEAKKTYGLPDESYVILKGKGHETFDKAVAGEAERGFNVMKFGSRYYSVPESFKRQRDAAEYSNAWKEQE